MGHEAHHLALLEGAVQRRVIDATGQTGGHHEDVDMVLDGEGKAAWSADQVLGREQFGAAREADYRVASGFDARQRSVPSGD
jgi:hypothetical protein